MSDGIQKTPFGQEGDYTFGAGALYLDADTDFIPAGFAGAFGTAVEVGKTGPLQITTSATYAEATSVQTGTEMDDAAVSGQKCEISTTLKQAGLDRLEKSVDGIYVKRDTDNATLQWGYVSVIGKRKRASAFIMTFVDIDSGVENWGLPFHILDFFETFTMSSETIATFDAENFRDIAVLFRTVQSEDHLDDQGRKAFFLSREITNN